MLVSTGLALAGRSTTRSGPDRRSSITGHRETVLDEVGAQGWGSPLRARRHCQWGRAAHLFVDLPPRSTAGGPAGSTPPLLLAVDLRRETALEASLRCTRKYPPRFPGARGSSTRRLGNAQESGTARASTG